MNDLEKEFVPYQQSLDMKKLGFDEPCFTSYDNEEKLRNPFDYSNSEPDCRYIEDSKHFVYNSKLTIDNFNGPKHLYTQFIAAPTFSQAFRFFREKYNLVSIIFNDDGDIEYDNLRYNWEIRVVTYSFKNMKNEKNACVGTYFYKTYKEAELKCLKKLIKICKTK